MYAVAGALAVDCVRHGHPAMVHTIVDCMGEFVRKSLTSWLKRRGGWVRDIAGAACVHPPPQKKPNNLFSFCFALWEQQQQLVTVR